MYTLIKGEKRHIAMEVSRRSSQEFVIDVATYDVEGIQSGTCEMDQEQKIVYFLIDTANEGFIKGNKYIAEFTVTIVGMEKIIKGKVVVHIT